MNDEDRKRLTEWLGECWHEEDVNATAQQIRDPRHRKIWAICANCGEPFAKRQDRTFTTPDDLWALYQQLHEKGLWSEWYLWSIKYHMHNSEDGYLGDYAYWLMIPARCQAVADFLKEGNDE